MNRQQDNLRRDLERRLERGEISFDDYRFMLAELSRSMTPSGPPPASGSASGLQGDAALFVSQGDWQTNLGDLDEPPEEFSPAPAPTPPPAPASVTPYPGKGSPPVGRRSGYDWSGATFGNYRLEHRVARGGMGEIWKATDLVGERAVAIKLLPPELKHCSEEMRRVKQAFDRVQALQHQNICPIYQLDWHDELGYFLVMKFLEAATLSVYADQIVSRFDQMPLEEVVRLLRPVAAALDYAHESGIVHRDIKPQNIMVSADGRNVQVVDFDLATVIRGTVARATQSAETISGTFSYMSPEQWKAAALDGRSDQYSLGMVAYELLAGRLPFESPDPLILRHCVLEDDVPPIDGLPVATQRALLQALSKSPADRFESCTAFVNAFAGEATITASGGSAPLGSASHRGAATVPQRRPKRPGDSTVNSANSGFATFRPGSGSARRDRLLGLRPTAGAPPSQADGKLIRESAARQLGKAITDITPEDLAQLRELDLSSTRLASLKPLDACPNLEKLNIALTPVSDITPLMSLSHLRELNVTSTEVASLIPLRALTRLRSLTLDQSRVEDLTPLRKLTGLRKLSAQNTKVQDLTAVGFLMQMVAIDLGGSWVREIRPLAMLRQLQVLSLSRALVTDLAPLAELTGLKTLLLAGVSASDLTPLGGMIGLECLSLRGTRVRSLEILASLAGLRQLSLAGTDVVDFSALRRLTRLQQLDLEGTTILDIEVLGKMSELRWLSLKDSPVESLAPLQGLSQLQHLDLRGTKLPLREIAAAQAAHPAAKIITSDN